MGLSTKEKLQVLDEVVRCSYDRAKSIKFIVNTRKMRYSSFHVSVTFFLFFIIFFFLGTKKCVPSRFFPSISI